jgi:hypothetical protein
MGNIAIVGSPHDHDREMQNILVSDNTYCTIPTIELRELIKQLRKSKHISNAEISSFLITMPYMVNYSYSQYSQFVEYENCKYHRSRTPMNIHIYLGGLRHNHKLILTKYQTQLLLDFEARANLIGSTPALTMVRSRIAKKELKPLAEEYEEPSDVVLQYFNPIDRHVSFVESQAA